ncbi:hypothetical protein FPOA_06389 [Fusarium poae]|uniref:Nephrocystin 3-like N-terminal domain-containing protein n=1 Tax=Fusarium poae TaxID=36050 RepID=A0A1B8AZF6_FUSPO|nr:hypothetical protein FPOA_06389 [Fusarium poae]
MPGAGKTITTAIAIEYLQSKFKDDPTVGLAYVYCSYQKREQQKPQELFTSLLKQLALHQPRLPKAIHKLYEKNHNGRDRPKFEYIVDSLCETIDLFSTTFVIIDALDEHDAWDAFLVDILRLKDKTTANIFLTSRPKPTLPNKLQNCLIYDIQADDEDVALYIDQRMTRMMVLTKSNTDLSQTVKASYRRLIREKLGKSVNGVFLLARIYLDNLEEETNLKGISLFLENLPTGLRAYADAYEKTIQRIRNQGQKHRDLAIRALSWLTFAREHVSKQAFRHAVSVEDGMSWLKEEDIQSTNVILHVCMGLVKTEESGTFSLLHFTTMEYLKTNPNCLLSLEPSDDAIFISNPVDWGTERSLAREYYEMKLASTCATYLLFGERRWEKCQMTYDDWRRPQQDPSPLYSYAGKNWAYHTQRGRLSNKILEFLKSKPHTSAASQFLSVLTSGFSPIPRFPVTIEHVSGLHLTSFFGLQRETTFLLSSGVEPDVRDGWSQTPLLYASAAGNINLVAQLLGFGVDPESKSIWKQSDEPRTALSHAAKRGHAGVVAVLLEKGKANPDSNPSFIEGEFERTPLSFASEAGHQDVVNILLDTPGVDLNSKGPVCRTPLHYAVQARFEGIVNSLLSKDDINPDFKNKEGKSPLHYAVLASPSAARLGSRCDAIVKSLLEVGANPDSRDREGKSPLHYAAQAGQGVIAKVLIATKMVDPDSSDDNGMTPLSLAARPFPRIHGIPILFPNILEQRPNAEQNQSLDDIVKAMTVNGFVNVNSKDNGGWTPLLHAAFQGHKSIVSSILILSDADPNIQDLKGRTALSHAVHGDPDILKLLLSHKDIKPDLKDRNGRTPFSHVMGPQFKSSFDVLLADDRVGVDNGDYSNRTPLSYAAESGNALALKLLLDNAKVNPNAIDTSGRTPISYAVSTVGLEAFKLLLADPRVTVDSQDMLGRTPLSYLAEKAQGIFRELVFRNNNYRQLRYCIRHGLGTDAAEFSEIRKLMKELVKDRGANVVSSDRQRRTPGEVVP